MKPIKLIFAIALLGAGGIGSAWADGRGGHWGHGGYHGGHARIGVAIGLGAPWYYPPAYYYPPYAYYPQPILVQPQEPPVYIEQQESAGDSGNYWYYCAKAKSYYPYVKECPAGWQRVLPQPPDQ
jgi:hypothetical protein